jgi:hypothetical protein
MQDQRPVRTSTRMDPRAFSVGLFLAMALPGQAARTVHVEFWSMC